MTLIVHELDAPVVQTIRHTRNVMVEAIRPHLVRYGNPVGSVKIQILNDANALIAESAPVSIADMGSQDYFHGYVRLDISAGLTKNKSYTIKLVGTDGYSFSESAYVAWANGFDLGKYPPAYVPEGSLKYPLDLEVWERKAR